MDQYPPPRLDRELICQAARIGLFWQWLLHQRARIFATLQDSRRRQRSRFYRQHVEHYVRHGIPDWSRRLYANGFLALWHQVPRHDPRGQRIDAVYLGWVLARYGGDLLHNRCVSSML